MPSPDVFPSRCQNKERHPIDKVHDAFRESGAGRAAVADTPQLLAYYDELERLDTGALWTVANKIEPWQPQSASVPVLWRYRDLRAHVLRSIDLVTPEKAGRRVIYLNNPGRRDVAAAVGWLYAGLQVMHPGEAASAHAHSASALRFIMEGTGAYTLLTIGPDGALLGRHRKLVPTWAEKLTWANGDASSLRVHQTAVGPLGSLACGENTNTLARFSLLAQGELVHVASYISLPVAPPDYDMAEAIRLRAAAHSFEGKVFTVVSCSTVSEDIIEAMAATHPKSRELLSRRSSAFSGILGPDGRVIGKPLIDEEGIVYADIDLSRCIQPRQMHDITGHYNRFDIFDLRVDRRGLAPARFRDDDAPDPGDGGGAALPMALAAGQAGEGTP